MANVTQLKNSVISEIRTITESQGFIDWLAGVTIPASGNHFIAINNSFIFRENIKTVKSDKFIAFDITSSKVFNIDNIYIITGIGFNTSFHNSLFLANKHTKTDLIDAINNELVQLGEVVYVLVGDIQDNTEFSESLSVMNFKSIKLNPTLTTAFEVQGDEIIIRDFSDPEQIWSDISQYCIDNSIAIPDDFNTTIEKKIQSLQKKAYSTLNIPSSFVANHTYLLDKIHQVVIEHLHSYSLNLQTISTDPKAMNEILRISYNFVSDINKLLTLLINVCDLKPIILWLTISKFYHLDRKFKELPFGFGFSERKKPSLQDYENLIQNARNRAFHRLFPFNKALKFDIQSIQNVSVMLFSSYSKNPQESNKMTYKDQALYDLLRNFTRTNEQVVSSNFWIKNELVMIAISDLILAVSQSIKSTK